MATVTVDRPRLSDAFLRANARNRIIAGTSEVIVEMGYDGARVSDIVRVCRVARQTFYGCFGSKEEAARALVADLGLDLGDISTHQALDVLLAELAATHHVRHSHHPDPSAAKLAASAEGAVRHLGTCELAEPPALDDPRQHTLPSGRTGITPKFRRENYRTRLLSGFIAAVNECGFHKTTVGAVCAHAHASRRAFYEHFGGVADVGLAMLRGAVTADLSYPPQIDGTLAAVAMEVVAQRLATGESKLASEVLAALPQLARAAS